MPTDHTFDKLVKIDKKLETAADIAMRDVLKTKKGESVLIITNPDEDVATISYALYNSALKLKAKPTLVFQDVKTQLDLAEDAVIKAIESKPDIAISISKEKLGKDKKRLEKPLYGKYNHYFEYLLATKKMRSFWSPSITLEMFKKTVPIDYKTLRKRADALKKLFDKATECHITAPGGTDVIIGLKGRKGFLDDGNFSKPGTGGNLPCGEMFISPALGASSGIIAFDGSISSDRGEIIIKKPIKCHVKKGFITRIEGGKEAKALEDTIKRAEKTIKQFVKDGKIPKKEEKSYIKNAKNLGELGIGLNEKAQIVGNMLEDEKVFKTCHIAVGSNYDNDANSLIHLDGLINKPTMTLKVGGKDKLVMKNGNILV